MRNHILLSTLLLFALTSCKENSKLISPETNTTIERFKKLNEFNWLVGSWVNRSGNKFSKETWTKENDSTLSAFSYTQIEKDTVFVELMLLQQKNDSVILTVTDGRNKNDIVPFKLISSDNGEHTFENKQHDFPERIIYTNPTQDSIHAWILGTLNGEARKVDFYFAREK
ncbi:hypothetical protein EI546_00290 [Aequorivita sp. H23M31]|uniref:DUF6265 domain-containing protein n=1 Tax=Aequorivita ciconiae TaxID=2494375 RepID=A0A451FSA2_9FLAO|nr:DUF6265 family protein [Aequorivita sp. H23M31]QAA80265.1 hypothetical protein EI546_00290 [Aequorivita sp. H23M31]